MENYSGTISKNFSDPYEVTNYKPLRMAYFYSPINLFLNKVWLTPVSWLSPLQKELLYHINL